MTKAKKLRKFTIKMKAEFGVGSYSNFKESEITVIETTLLIEELRAVRSIMCPVGGVVDPGTIYFYGMTGEIEDARHDEFCNFYISRECSCHVQNARDAIAKLDTLIREIEDE